MSLTTFSKFYYGFNVDQTNLYVSFDEGAGELLAAVDVGEYSLNDGMGKVAAAMTDAGTQAYGVALDRVTRLVTVSATNPFTLKVTSATPSNTIFSLIGFTGADRTGTNIYTGNLPIGSVYEPQFVLQDHIKPEHFRKSIDATVKKTASGAIEVVRFGEERFLQCNIKYITNLPQDCGVIKNNPQGIEDLEDFMSFITSKREVEFMADASDSNTFISVILDKTSTEQNGTGFTLKELYDKNLPNYFETGILTFRVVE